MLQRPLANARRLPRVPALEADDLRELGSYIFQGKAAHPKKPPTQIKTVCASGLRKLFCLFSAYFKREKGDSLYKLSRNCLRKLLVQTVFVWVGGFLGWVFPP